MAQGDGVNALTERFLAEMGRIGYADKTMQECRRACRRLVEFAEGRGETAFSEALAVDFVNDRHALGITGLYQRPVPGSEHARFVTRCMRKLLGFQENGRIPVTMPGTLQLAALPNGLQALLDSYDEAGRRGGYSKSTLNSRSCIVKRFLSWCQDNGVDADVYVIRDGQKLRLDEVATFEAEEVSE